MPIYEFLCPACGERFDRLQKLSDPDPESCPNCGATGVRRQVTAPAFRLAGSGWYETDFKKEGDRKRNLAEKDAAKESKPPDAAPKADSSGGGGKDKSDSKGGAVAKKPAPKAVGKGGAKS